MNASQVERLDVVESLLGAQADPSYKAPGGLTAVLVAAKQGYFGIKVGVKGKILHARLLFSALLSGTRTSCKLLRGHTLMGYTAATAAEHA